MARLRKLDAHEVIVEAIIVIINAIAIIIGTLTIEARGLGPKIPTTHSQQCEVEGIQSPAPRTKKSLGLEGQVRYRILV